MWTHIRRDPYFDWLCNLVDNDTDICQDYSMLLEDLHLQPFAWSHYLDDARMMDGLQLRWMFCNEYQQDYEFINDFRELYYTKACSVLEVLVALAIKAGNNDYGHVDSVYPVSLWFWKVFCKNLGLLKFTNDKHNGPKIYDKLLIFMLREYSPDGTGGGLFPIKCYKEEDLRTVALYNQMGRWVRRYGEPKW